MKTNGGDDGARTRDFRLDRFAFRANQIMELPVLSAASERQGPTWNAIKCPKPIHLVHAYCTHILTPEYLNSLIFDTPILTCTSTESLLLTQEIPVDPLWSIFKQRILCRSIFIWPCKEPKGLPNSRLGSAPETPRCFDGIGHTSASLKPRQYCAAIRGFPQIRPGVPTRGIIPKAVA